MYRGKAGSNKAESVRDRHMKRNDVAFVEQLAGKLRVNDDFSLSAQRTDKKTISTTR